MDLHAERLKKMLDHWEDPSLKERSATKAALQILKTIEDILAQESEAQIEPALWHRCLNATGKSNYLGSLTHHAQRLRWTEAAFKIIQRSEYSLRDMFEQRVSENSRRILFQDMSGASPVQWTYEQIAQHLREIATLFHIAGSGEPRVAIFSDNCVEGACCDLACLCYDIIDTALNPHFDETVLCTIFDRLKINIAVTDTEEHLKRLQKVQKLTKEHFKIFVLDPNIPAASENESFLGEKCAQLSKEEIDSVLANRTRRPLNRIATVMFTSGSTGEPKGVSFSIYNLVSKRFARAAALPGVGKDETFVCYLPLYHTFGRYLEMLGTIYWGGTYVFAGNPSTEKLFLLFPEINPTGFISVPIRWAQLYEKAVEKMGAFRDPKKRSEAFRSVVGKRLRWGLSAAGYLSPSVFRFFQNNGVELCSGFGMTEAVGGITMTPPGAYIDNTMGIPLPGITTRISQNGELEISGHYVARYLDEKGPDEVIPYPESKDKDHWISTGDVFRMRPNGYHEIVDRIKDIYKNAKGQTIAPRKLESKFTGVPGVKHAFMVGEGRSYNVLLIVPDLNDPVLKSAPFQKDPREYFRKLIAAANQTLAPYERVVNFTLLERDLDIGKGELSFKGTFKRKAIEANFADQIESLYKKNFVELKYHDYVIRIPRWFFRDVSTLEDNIKICSTGLHNRRTGLILPIKKNASRATVLIGDLEYKIAGKVIDMELFTRQPRLWAGNPSMISFCPCKEGWDVQLQDISPQVFRPLKGGKAYSAEELPELKEIRDPVLILMNRLLSVALHGDKESALRSIEKLAEKLRNVDERMEDVIRRRLEALSHHPDEDVRCLAYRTLLLDERAQDLSKFFPTFILSGLSFLNEESIRIISTAKLSQRRLDALRKRMFIYRTQLEWPVSPNTRLQIENVLKMLSEFADKNPEFYNSVRAELASWAFHRLDRTLARRARKLLDELAQRYETRLHTESPETTRADWAPKLVFDEGLSASEVKRIEKVLIGTSFLKQSIILGYDERKFELDDVADSGIWISRIESSSRHAGYRVSVNTKTGKHYSFMLRLSGIQGKMSIPESVYLHASIAGYPFGASVLPRLGCYRPDLAGYSSRYHGDLTLWERIREYRVSCKARNVPMEQRVLRKLLVQGFEAFFRGWHRSGRLIVPGAVSPENVIISELGFQESTRILSLTQWSRYRNGLSLVRPMLKNFYGKILAHYPSAKGLLDVRWIFDACIEALGEKAAEEFFAEMIDVLKRESIESFDETDIRSALIDYSRKIKTEYYAPMPLRNATERYKEWELSTPTAPEKLKEQAVLALYITYQLHLFPEIARYHLYRHTYFAHAETSITSAFDRFLADMRKEGSKPAVQLVSLSDLHDALTKSDDREVFSRMIFPRLPPRGRVDVLKIGESGSEQIVVRSRITDRYGESYTCREAVELIEIGKLYRLFFLENQPISISSLSKHIVVVDSREEIVGGICYTVLEDGVVEIEGLIVVSPLREHGIEAAIVEDFCTRMAGHRLRIVKAPLVSGEFFLKCGFTTDPRWSCLVKSISSDRITL